MPSSPNKSSSSTWRSSSSASTVSPKGRRSRRKFRAVSTLSSPPRDEASAARSLWASSVAWTSGSGLGLGNQLTPLRSAGEAVLAV
eukprot:CAMPEP_0181506976 /NCGR_PEP_ID=MMETSP1110-20121109/58896_1 /TAXON_ID=174948 /ORGANISM="Symbiodinium sp., Strain CCMP421" /LENGTH=85 /DNA_ID=CAMNT_0023636099 /DNA_START=64 /DNA_END=321 /DNA_ORIENTATION=+